MAGAMGAASLPLALWALAVLAADLAARRIPNLLSVGGALAAALWLAVFQQTPLGVGWQSALAGCALGLLLGLPAYLARWLGGGDAKLLLALGLLLGWRGLLASFAVAGLLSAAAIVGLALAARYGLAPARKRWLPFGAALAAGMLVTIGFGI